MWSKYGIKILILTCIRTITSFKLLSTTLQGPLHDLPSPSLIFDVERYIRNCDGVNSLEEVKGRYVQKGWDASDTVGCFFLHTSVRESYAKPNLPLLDFRGEVSSLYLSLGLNNHYVGGYYWARAGMGIGAAMEAPGVDFDAREGRLKWGELNSNDGKRSEWVEFLKPGDQVQLCVGDSKELKAVMDAVGGGGDVMVVSGKDVPKGAEPRVVAALTFVIPEFSRHNNSA